MKSLRILTIAGMLLGLSGCFAEDYSFCVTDVPEDRFNVTLNFRLPGDGGADIFADNISTVTTAVYDEGTGSLVNVVTTADADHAKFKGVGMMLDPGTYKVVCWANSGVNTELKDPEACYLGDAFVTYGSIMNVKGNGDALYYAPNTVVTRQGNAAGEYIMTVDPATGHEGTLDFRHAHRRINVYVRGFDMGGSTTPVIRLTGLPSGLRFLGMQPIEGAGLVNSEIPSSPVSITLPEGVRNYALSAFNTFYLRTGNYDIGIDVIDPAGGSTIYTTMLNDHITPETDSAIDVDIEIQLLIEFKNAEVTVSIPDWNSEDVGYGIFD